MKLKCRIVFTSKKIAGVDGEAYAEQSVPPPITRSSLRHDTSTTQELICLHPAEETVAERSTISLGLYVRSRKASAENIDDLNWTVSRLVYDRKDPTEFTEITLLMQ